MQLQGENKRLIEYLFLFDFKVYRPLKFSSSNSRYGLVPSVTVIISLFLWLIVKIECLNVFFTTPVRRSAKVEKSVIHY